MKVYHFFATIVGELDSRRHITHMHDLPTPTLIILKWRHKYRDRSYRVSTQIRKFLGNSTLLLPSSLPTHSLTNTTHNLNPKNPHNISYYPYSKSLPKDISSDELKDNHNPWIVQYPRKRQNQIKIKPHTEPSYKKKIASNPNQFFYHSSLDPKKNISKPVWIEQSTQYTNATQTIPPTLSHSSKSYPIIL